MSRFYDRVMQNGCEPFSARHIFETWDPDDHARLFGPHLAEELGRDPSPAEIAVRMALLKVGAQRSVSSDFIGTEDVVVISAEQVADYWATLPSRSSTGARSFRFSTYATWWIRQACLRAIANQSRTIRVPAHVHERRVKLAHVSRRLEAERGHAPRNEELAEAAGFELQHVEEALGAVEVSVSLNQTVGEDGGGELGDHFADPAAPDPAEEAGETLRRQAVRTALRSLPELERRVLGLRFGFDGEQQPLEAIERELGISRERVRKLERDAFARLEAELNDAVAATADELANAA